MSKEVKNELGRAEVAPVIERMIGNDKWDALDVLKFTPPAIAELVGDALKEKQKQAATDESVKLEARFEFRSFFSFTAQIESATRKDVRNPKTGEVTEGKYFPARVITHPRLSPVFEEMIEKYIDLDKS